MKLDPKYVTLFGEFDAPKGSLEPYLNLMKKSSKAFATWVKEGIIMDFHSWTDNTGHFVVFIMFETIEKFGEIWNKEEFHDFLSESSMVVENQRIRLMRPAFAPK